MPTIFLRYHHEWNVTEEEAIALQERLRAAVIPRDDFGPIQYIAGVDAQHEDGLTRAAVAVFQFPDLVLHEIAVAERPTSFPYEPGLLAFRELPAMLEALERLKTLPDLVLCDGHGYAHPRRFGLACHLGVLVGWPTLGVAKTPYVGQFEPVPPERGIWQPIIDRGEIVGATLRTQTGVAPVFVSLGHRIGLASTIRFVLKCTPRYRLPEPIRAANQAARRRFYDRPNLWKVGKLP